MLKYQLILQQLFHLYHEAGIPVGSQLPHEEVATPLPYKEECLVSVEQRL